YTALFRSLSINIFAYSWPDQNSGDQSSGTAYGMNHRRTCKIDKAGSVQPSIFVKWPVPTTGNGIDQCGKNGGKDQIGGEFGSFGNSSRHNGGRSCAKNSLEEQIVPIGRTEKEISLIGWA